MKLDWKLDFLKSILIQFHYFFFLQKCMHIELNLISWKYSNTLENLETHMNKLLKVHLLKNDLKTSINASSLSCINNQRIWICHIFFVWIKSYRVRGCLDIHWQKECCQAWWYSLDFIQGDKSYKMWLQM